MVGLAPDAPVRRGGPAEREVRRFATVRHLAELYDRYALRRPEMLQAWAIGEDTDGAGRALPHDGVWQAELWRRLRTADRAPEPGRAA